MSREFICEGCGDFCVSGWSHKEAQDEAMAGHKLVVEKVKNGTING